MRTKKIRIWLLGWSSARIRGWSDWRALRQPGTPTQWNLAPRSWWLCGGNRGPGWRGEFV